MGRNFNRSRWMWALWTAGLGAVALPLGYGTPLMAAEVERPAIGTIDLGDYCTVLLAPKLQDELQATPEQREELAHLKTILNGALDHAAGGDTHGQRLTPGLVAQRGHGAIGAIGEKVRDALTAEQDAKLVSMFAKKVLKSIEVKAAVVSSGGGITGRGGYVASGIELVYTHFGETGGTATRIGGDTPSKPTTSPTTPKSSTRTPTELPPATPSHVAPKTLRGSDSARPPVTAAAPGAQLEVLDEFRLEGKRRFRNSHVTFSPDGSTLLVNDGSLLAFWDVTGEPKEIRTVDAASLGVREIRAVRYSPDGKLLALAAEDKSVRLYGVDGDGLVPLDSKVEHDAPVWTLEFSHSGKLLVSGGDDMAITFWDVTGNKLRRRSMFKVENAMFGVKHLAFSPDDHNLVAVAGTGQVRMIDVRGTPHATELCKLPCTFDLPMALSPDGKTLLFGSQQNARIWTNHEVTAVTGHTKKITSVAWNSDGKSFATCGEDGRVVVWDSAGRTRYVDERPSGFTDVAFRPMGEAKQFAKEMWLAVPNSNGTVFYLHLGNAGKTDSPTTPATPTAPTLKPAKA